MHIVESSAHPRFDILRVMREAQYPSRTLAVRIRMEIRSSSLTRASQQTRQTVCLVTNRFAPLV